MSDVLAIFQQYFQNSLLNYYFYGFRVTLYKIMRSGKH